MVSKSKMFLPLWLLGTTLLSLLVIAIVYMINPGWLAIG